MNKPSDTLSLESSDHTLTVDNGPSLRFNGELVAFASSGSEEDNRFGRWTELFLYKTQTGQYICHKVGGTTKDGERYKYDAHVCGDTDSVISYFGHKWLAKRLYADAIIEDVVHVK